MPSNLTSLSAIELAQRIAAREFSCAEVMTIFLDHIDTVNPSVNAIVSRVERPDLLSQAAAMDAGPPRGPLYGLPFAVKDLDAVHVRASNLEALAPYKVHGQAAGEPIDELAPPVAEAKPAVATSTERVLRAVASARGTAGAFAAATRAPTHDQAGQDAGGRQMGRPPAPGRQAIDDRPVAIPVLFGENAGAAPAPAARPPTAPHPDGRPDNPAPNS